MDSRRSIGAIYVISTGGVKRTNWVNAAIVTVSIVALLAFIITGHQQTAVVVERASVEWWHVLQAAALLLLPTQVTDVLPPWGRGTKSASGYSADRYFNSGGCDASVFGGW